jgi:hypothetical protein
VSVLGISLSKTSLPKILRFVSDTPILFHWFSLFLCQYCTVSITITSQNTLKPWDMIPPALTFCSVLI